MKRLFLILVSVLLIASVFAQPNQMSYQAVIRDANNYLVINKSIGMRVSIIVHYGPAPHILYQETYSPNPTTNVNGLVTLAIGSGTPVTGTFSGINWRLGSYSIQTETDPTGGTNYTITGTSSLLSVPFALNANKADSVKYSNPIQAGNHIMITGSGTTASPYVINDSIHKIGEHYGGGIVFYVYNNGRHGLIADTQDLSSAAAQWDAGTSVNTMAFADGIGAGKANTAIIIASLGYGNGSIYAARVCNEYSVTEGGVFYGDWYLPSKYELNLMYLNIGPGAAAPNTNIGGFGANLYYWSSTEISNSLAWIQNFTDGSQSSMPKENPLNKVVRAIRAF